MTEQTPHYSFVVPVYNEVGNVEKLHGEIVGAAKKLDKPYEIIFVDDGSTDDTLKILKTLSPIKILVLRKNSGQSAALDAGIKSAQGEILITMDGDGQNDPADVPKMLKKFNGFDVVCGWRHRRKDPIAKRFISSGARFLRSFLVADKVHDAGCTLRVYKKECFADLDLYGEMHRMIPALLAWNGFRLTEVKVNHRPRKAGRTKYSWQRMFKGFLDMINVWFWRKYESRPLHLFGTLGILAIGGSFLFGIYLGVRRMFFNYSLSNKIWPLIAVTGFITGIQLLIFGILADLIIKNRPKNNFYHIREIIEN
ncbi:MAG: glycosyltransferase family 2 protein [Patescibacteria group bacterium]|jgi:glycosyltransferase involved in cell wall biosynthesis